MLGRNYSSLKREGDVLPVEAVIELVIQACQLELKPSQKANFSTGQYEGQISTEGKYYSLGFIKGTLFFATIEGEFGKAEVAFIVDTSSAKKALGIAEPKRSVGTWSGDFEDWSANGPAFNC